MIGFREQLGRAIQLYQNSNDNDLIKFELPSDFFIQLQTQHEKLLGMF
jgi:hypothetical protein